MSEHHSRDNTRREVLRKTTTLKIGMEPGEPTGLFSAIGAWVQRILHLEFHREHAHEIEEVDREATARSIPSEQREQLTKDRAREALAENQRIHETKQLTDGKPSTERQPASPEDIARAASELEAKILELRALGYTIEVPDYHPPGTDSDEPRPYGSGLVVDIAHDREPLSPNPEKARRGPFPGHRTA